MPLVYYLVSRCEARPRDFLGFRRRPSFVTARWPALLFAAIVLVAPVAEQLLFRGFLYGGFRACGAPIWVTVIVVSSAFAALHTQYDLYDVSHVFVLALMLMAAWVRFDSIVPGVAMYTLTNAVGFVEAAVLS